MFTILVYCVSLVPFNIRERQTAGGPKGKVRESPNSAGFIRHCQSSSHAVSKIHVLAPQNGILSLNTKCKLIQLKWLVRTSRCQRWYVLCLVLSCRRQRKMEVVQLRSVQTWIWEKGISKLKLSLK